MTRPPLNVAHSPAAGAPAGSHTVNAHGFTTVAPPSSSFEAFQLCLHIPDDSFLLVTNYEHQRWTRGFLWSSDRTNPVRRRSFLSEGFVGSHSSAGSEGTSCLSLLERWWAAHLNGPAGWVGPPTGLRTNNRLQAEGPQVEQWSSNSTGAAGDTQHLTDL